jgi:hypothetical protein
MLPFHTAFFQRGCRLVTQPEDVALSHSPRMLPGHTARGCCLVTQPKDVALSHSPLSKRMLPCRTALFQRGYCPVIQLSLSIKLIQWHSPISKKLSPFTYCGLEKAVPLHILRSRKSCPPSHTAFSKKLSTAFSKKLSPFT